jgi:hypothetical protein
VYVPADDNVVVSMNFVLLEKVNPVEAICAELGSSNDTV